MILSSLDKHLTILDILADHPKGLTLSALSAITGQPISSLHHALSTFKAKDFIRQEPETKKYVLGYKFLRFGGVLLNNLDIRNVAKTELERLNSITEEMVLLSVLSQGNVVYLDKVHKAYKMYQDIEIGYTSPAYTSTSGKALLAGLSDEELYELFPNPTIKFPDNGAHVSMPIEEHLVEDRDELFYELNQIRARGYYYGEELYYRGVRAIAAPVFLSKKVACAICITGSRYSMTPQKINEVVIPNLLQATQNISQLLTHF